MFQIEVGPLQSEYLSFSRPNAQGKPKKRFQSITSDCFPKSRDLGLIVNLGQGLSFLGNLGEGCRIPGNQVPLDSDI